MLNLNTYIIERLINGRIERIHVKAPNRSAASRIADNYAAEARKRAA